MGKKEIKTTLEIKEVSIKDTEGAKDDWNTQHTATYMGIIEDKISIKMVLSSKDPELLKAVVQPSRKQKFSLILTELTPEERKLSDFQKKEKKEKKNKTEQESEDKKETDQEAKD